MAVRRELEVVIKPDGSLSLDVRGNSGPGCLDLTKDLESRLGVVVDREKKPEFYVEVDEQERIKLED